ncbi:MULTISPECIES: tetrahydromethanopterin S-methyltransferase subunit A [Methanobacterium]|uniref:Tetrahydromethanopterin S-methyltransferase subunit A n=1 Tax=Methanobacterium formicicum TaxID=2162 RepID=A0A090I2G3_METFO|nr:MULTISPECIES: tetrahydromethanopterin S-methyltransferase subunit A [Methanobacterium]AIS31747.1 tetrahydromethanopterin S-methyltransferase subunit A MtrA1 [Methanobacterium formicicum]KUK75003.1 MAG: Tetrahydromethanopterin S-methyltransferase subunit A [Methanobacterium sp. 42_16]MBF4473862.1 tetrahydromethanopterin S-methyltransferase subunit A [Methanobacterium formicicum]MDD4811260.1 tetrahydromethanopterin S-methyltransferase subunit A [Methanobacterium formicicum]MDG3548195.1 tetrah
MAEKKSPAEGWPVINGDYVVGDPESPVAATTLASHIEQIAVDAGAAISGPCKTENLGIEKMLANLISNPNIRFLILTGSEVQGHITGQSIEALHENGVDPEKRKIVGATGAIPFIENIPDEGIERFQQQMEIVSIIDVEDAATIQSKVKECIDKDPGAFEEEAMVIVVEEDGEEEEGEEVPPVAPETALIEARMRNIQTQVKSIGGLNRMAAGMYSGKVQGIMIGLVFILTIGTILLLK